MLDAIANYGGTVIGGAQSAKGTFDAAKSNFGGNKKLEKLKIYPADKSPSSAFEAMVNPSSIKYSTSIEYVKDEAQGNVKSENKFAKYGDETYEFTLILDGTGVIGKDSDSVTDAIKNFKKIALQYVGNKHEPNKVKLSWGNTIDGEECRLKNFSIDYKLFDTDGSPLRADMQVTFVAATDLSKEAKVKKSSSPDLTHVRVVKKGDTLPMMCQNIYGDSSMYVEVAKANELVNFRYLEPGSEIIFPPIKK